MQGHGKTNSINTKTIQEMKDKESHGYIEKQNTKMKRIERTKLESTGKDKQGKTGNEE